jgi:hypothetical protein
MGFRCISLVIWRPDQHSLGFFFSFDRAKRDSNEKKKRVEEDGYSLAGAIMREDKAHHHAKRNYTTQTGNRSNK